MKHLLIFLFFVFGFLTAHAQMKSDTLKEIEIKDRKISEQNSKIHLIQAVQNVEHFDSSVLRNYQNLATFLAAETNTTIKSFGINGLSTASFRGASAAQTQIVWNGLPINNAAMGMADLSSLPTATLQQVDVIHGSAAILFGSGSVGGTVSMQSEQPKFKCQKAVDFFSGFGSFGQQNFGAQLKLANEKYFFQVGALNQFAENNILYKNLNGTEQLMNHARLNGNSVIGQFALNMDSKSTIQILSWYQNFQREIPAALFEAYSAKTRKDETFRLIIDWTQKRNTTTWMLKTAISKEHFEYKDSLAWLDNNNQVFQSFTEFGWEKRGKYNLFKIGLPVQINWLDDRQQIFQQSRIAMFGIYSIQIPKVQIVSSYRLEKVNNLPVQFLPNLSAKLKWNDQYIWKASIQKTFRAPSLNELYFQPGGNVNLLPESGWSAETGIEQKKNWRKPWTLEQSLFVYNRIIDNWIYWLGGAIWTPHNIATVNSRGLELQQKIKYKFKKAEYFINSQINITKSTTEKSDLPNDGSIGKQLPYIPKLQMLFQLGIKKQNWNARIIYQYVGNRYINTDETGNLSFYELLNFDFGYIKTLKKVSIQSFIQFNNIFDVSYFVVNQRPMPGRNFQIGLRCSWLKN